MVKSRKTPHCLSFYCLDSNMNETCSSMANPPQDNAASSPQSEIQNGEDNVGSESQSSAVPLKELEYGVMSFYAIVKPGMSENSTRAIPRCILLLSLTAVSSLQFS